MNRKILIGVIITDCHVDFQIEIMRGIISQAFKSKCDIAVISPLYNFYADSVHKDTEKEIFKLILSDKFDGFIYDRNTFYNEEIRQYIDDLCTKSGKPVMLLDYGDHKCFETTSADDCEAFEAITDHLIETHNLKKIYCLTGPKNIYCSEERLKGYMRSMKKHNLFFDKSYYEYGNFWTDTAKAYAEKIISGELEQPDAVVCGNDVTAIAVAETLISNGIRVPEDIAVTGYDASMEGYQAEPSITSYVRPNFQLGTEALRRLYRIITGRICNKVRNERGELRIGRSCGCMENPRIRKSIRRKTKINNDFESKFLHCDMLFDITNADNLQLFFDKLDNYTHLLYKMNRLCICLTEKYVKMQSAGLTEHLSFEFGDNVSMMMAKSAVYRESTDNAFFSTSELLPVFNTRRNYPSAYYISPLHYNDNFFGYAAISFGKEALSFTSLYIQWINYVNVALEQVRIKAIMNNTIVHTDKSAIYDDPTGLYNRSSLKHEFEIALKSLPASAAAIHCICIELSSLKKTYYQCGSEKTDNILSGFADALKSCLRSDELCGVWASNYFVIITVHSNRAAEIFNEMRVKVSESRYRTDSYDMAFSIGECTSALLPHPDLSEMVYKATVNKVNSYTIQDSNVNPQFEKLCMLRNSIRKNPEKPWNISEIAESMYLSKSYLQKIYKNYFNKSIIEEMIQFRINKAKELLTNTEETVTDISKECGYSSYNYFVRQFKMCENVSPSEYRESIRKKSQEE